MLAQSQKNFISKSLSRLQLQIVLLIFLVLPVAAIAGLGYILIGNGQSPVGDVLLGLVALSLAILISLLVARWITGYTVIEAANGDEALQFVTSHPEYTLQLLLTDIIMPHLGGNILAERLKASYPGLKVLFISGYTDDILRQAERLRAKVPFLSKPFTPTALAQKVRAVLDSFAE